MSGSPWNATDTERLRTLAFAGLSTTEIALDMKRSKDVIRTWALKMNIPIAKTAHPSQQRSRLQAARLQQTEIGLKEKKT